MKKEKKTYSPQEFFAEIICKKFSKKEIECGIKNIKKLEKILKSFNPPII